MKYLRFAFAILLCCIYSARAQGTIAVSPNVSSIGTYGVFELTISHDDAPYANKWEGVEITCPFINAGTGDTLVMYGFYYDTDTWKVRFAPPAEGTWTWTLAFDTGSGVLTGTGTFSCTGSARKGFTRRHASNPYRMVYADGSLFDGYGLQGCLTTDLNNLYIDGSRATIEKYAATFGQGGAGMNLFRWTIDNNCVFRIFDVISTDGNRYVVEESKAGDRLLQSLTDKGFRIMLAFFGFTVEFGTSFWERDGYWNEDQQRQLKHYLRYMVARYGPYVDVWEMMNEHYGRSDWLRGTTAFIRSIDPYGRLITTSWEMAFLDCIDIGSPHFYFGVSDPQLCDSAVIASSKYGFAKQKSIAAKPVIYGEFGNYPGNWFGAQSPTHMRIVSWTAFFYEIMQVYWHDGWKKQISSGNDIYLDPESQAYIRYLTDFTREVHPDVVMFTPEQSTAGIRSYGLRGGNMLCAYFHHHTNHTATVNASVSVDLPGPGTAFWYNPSTGDTVSQQGVSTGRQVLGSPGFAIDCALKIVLDDSAFSQMASPGPVPFSAAGFRMINDIRSRTVTVTAADGQDIRRAVLFDAAGRPTAAARSGYGTARLSLSTAGLPGGVYLLAVSGTGGMTAVARLVVVP